MRKEKISEDRLIRNECIEVSVNNELAPFCKECYLKLGWSLTSTKVKPGKVCLSLQRDRKIKNRTALTELQHKCEDAFLNIEKLEKLNTPKASKVKVISFCVGLTALAVMAGTIFSYFAAKYLLCVILAIITIIDWCFFVILYKKYLHESTKKRDQLIKRYYEEIYEACDKAKQLLKA